MNNIKLLISDIDIIKYNLKNKKGIELLKNKNIKTMIITSLKSDKTLLNICNNLNIEHIVFESSNKMEDIINYSKSLDITLQNIAYISNDINDIDILNNVGISASHVNAYYKCKNIVDYICINNEDYCLREFIDYLLYPKKKTFIMDCLLRDGGIVNDWNFSIDFINEYIHLMDNLNIDYIEIGYFSNITNTNNNILKNINISNINNYLNFDNIKNTKISIMGDYGKFNLDNIPDKKINKNPIDLIRIAGPLDMFENIEKYIIDIKRKGYNISLNIMNSSHLKNSDLNYLLNKYNLLKIKPDFLYIADSLGALIPNDIQNIYKYLKNIECSNLGFHGHNNMQLALSNSLEAIKMNFNIIDTCVFGMGKGAGNLPLELYLLYVIKYNNNKYNIQLLLNFIDKHFKCISKYNWGYDTKYAITGILNASSRFAEYIINNNNNNKLSDIYNIITNIPNSNRIKYSKPKIKCCCIIPARYGSKRLKGKLLIKIDNVSVIRRTCLQALKCKKIDKIYVTTDNEKIEKEVIDIGIDVIKITDECNNGTERVYKAYIKNNENYDIIINIQGDESFFKPDDIDDAINYHILNTNYCTCLHSKSKSYKEIKDNSKTKVCLNKNNKIMYISRSIIPGYKEDNEDNELKFNNLNFNIHLGVYIFSPKALKDINHMLIHYNENIESIEILRFLENDKEIYSFEVENPYIQINTINDINELKKYYKIII